MQQELVKRFFSDVWTKGDMEAADSIFAAEHVNHDPNHTWTTRGAEGVKRQVSVYRNAFPDIAFKLEECLWAEPFVVTRWTLTGTHAGRLFRVAPTGRTVTISGMQFDRIEANRIVETWSQWDMLSLFEQIGMLPTRLRADTEDVDLAYWKTHKMWWQADEKGRDDHTLLDDPGPGGQ